MLAVLVLAAAGTNDVGRKFLEEAARLPGVVALPSGLLYKVLREGAGGFHPTANSPMFFLTRS